MILAFFDKVERAQHRVIRHNNIRNIGVYTCGQIIIEITHHE